MSSKLEADVRYRVRVEPSGESYGGNRRPGGKNDKPTARWNA